MMSLTAQRLCFACLAMGLLLAGNESASAATPANTELGAKIEAVQKEAYGLKQKSRTASPEELKQIDRRAGELLDQLRALGLPVPKNAPRIPGKVGSTPAVKKTETTAGHPPEPGKIKPAARALPNEPAFKRGGGAQTTPIAKSMAGEKTGIVRLPPERVGSKLVIRDINRTNTLKQRAGEAFDLVFPLGNTGDAASARTSYSISCTALRGGDCPFSRKPGSLSPIAPGKSGEINLKGLKFRAGEYELTLKIGSGVSQTAKLEVAAGVKPEAAKGVPRLKPAQGAIPNGQQPRPRLRLP